MGGKGKSGPVQTNSQITQMQMQAAADAKEKDLQRTARLQQGVSSIDALFDGTGGGAANKLDLSSLASGNAGWAFDPFRANGTIWNEGTKTWDKDPAAQLGNGYSYGVEKPEGGDVNYALYGPDGFKIASAPSLQELSKQNVYLPGTGGDSASGGGTSGGFNDAFYNKFRNSIIDYYMPQEAEQYADARSKLGYSLARAGTLNSSIAGTDVSKLSEQDQINQAQIGSQADTQTAGLRTQVAQARQQALAQLYSTEDPSVAANTATNLVANANLTTPLLNPAGALFAPITAGVGNAISGYVGNAAYIGGGAQTGSGAAAASDPNKTFGSNVSGLY